MLKAKRLDVVEQLDRVVFALSTYAYFADPSFLLLLLRLLVQAQLSRPHDFPKRRITAFASLVTLLFLFSLLRNHMYGPGSSNPPSGVFLDFVGQGTPATSLTVAAQTALIYVLQLVCLLVAYETGHTPPPRDVPYPFFPIAPPEPTRAEGSATPELDDLEAQTTGAAGKTGTVPYSDFLSPLPVERKTSVRSRKGKERAVETDSPNVSSSLLLPDLRPPSSLGEDEDGVDPLDFAYLQPDPSSPDDPSSTPIFTLRLLPFLSRLSSVGPYAAPPPAPSEGETGGSAESRSEWETFWSSARGGGRSEMLSVGLGGRRM